MNNEVKTNDQCTLADSELKQCCCNCEFHKATYRHCCVDRKPEESRVCGIQNGWACCIPESKRIHINWPEHSAGCEMYTAKKTLPVKDIQ